MVSSGRSAVSERGGVLRLLHRQRRLICLSYRKLALVGVLSALAGLGQAALLLVIVRGATALTADTQSISGRIGPISASNLTTSELIAIGLAILAGLFIVELANAFTQASLAVEASRGAQHRMLRRYSAANFDAQTRMTRGESRQVVMGYPASVGGIATNFGSGFNAAISFITLAGSAVIISPTSALVVMVGLGALMMAMRPLLFATRKLSRQRTYEQRMVNGLAGERFELTRELKSVGAERHVDRPILEGISRVARLDRKVRVLSRMSSVTYRLGAYALILAMLAVIDASNTTNLTVLTGSLLMLLRSLSYGQAAQSSYQKLTEAVPVVEQLLEEEQRLIDAAENVGGEALPADFHIGDIEFEHVSFAYPGADLVLHDVSLKIPRGEFLALVGPSGAGKSTLMQLLLRLREPSNGRVLIDGQVAATVPLSWWRSRVAYVAQEPKLQSGTVAEAIRFGRPGISDEEVRIAARRAHIDTEIDSWADGYETNVGQLGENVSGGQRQRLALARALAGDPDLLLLDEPTSALDPVSEQLVAQTLEELQGTITIVVIAHRIHTVENAGRAVRVEQGRLIPHEGGADAVSADLPRAVEEIGAPEAPEAR